MGGLVLGFGVFQIGAIAFALTFWAVLFWGSVKIVDAENSHNRFGSAMAWSVVHLLLSFALAWSEVFGLVVYAAWLVFMLRLLVDFYGVGLLKSLLAIGISNAAPFALAPIFARVILTSGEGGALLILFGFPIVTFVVWLGPGMQQRKREAAARPDGMPVAKLFRRRSKPAPEAPAAAPAPARPSAPQVRPSGPQPAVRSSDAATRPSASRQSGSQPVAPVIAPPPIPVAPPPIPVAAPRATTDAASGPVGEPTFLR